MLKFLRILCLLPVLLFGPGCHHKASSDKVKSNSDSTRTLDEINTRLRTNPQDAAAYQERARYQMGQKKFSEALSDMKRAISIDSSHAHYYLTIADIYFVLNQTRDSKTALETCNRLDPKNTDCMLKLAELYFYVRKYQKSLDYLDEVLKLDQYNAKAYFMKGMNFKETGDTAKALSSMQTAVEQDNTYYNAYIQLGLLCAARHDRLAEDYFANALRLQPQSPEALYACGKLYQDEQNYGKAKGFYTQLLTISKDFFDASYNLGVIATKEQKYTEALNYFSDAIGSAPKNPRGYYGRGCCYQLQKDASRAAADFKYALTLDPNYEPAKTGLSQVSGK
jgi:tetratricopeptide (TPR) repeat protein